VAAELDSGRVCPPFCDEPWDNRLVIDTLGEMLPFTVGVALSPAPIIVVVLLLLAPVGTRGGAAFLVGRLVGLTTVVTVFVLLSDYVTEASGSSVAVSLLRIAVGLALVALAVSKWRTRPRGDDEVALPRWMGSIDTMSSAGALRFGVILTVANPKELAFGAGAGLIIGGSTLPLGQEIIVTVVFALVASVSVIGPVIAVAVAGDRMAGSLESAREWLLRNNQVVLGTVLLIIGALLVGNGVSAL
jgi:hypothetical protein